MDIQIYKKLKEFGKVKNNVFLSKFTTLKIGGLASVFIEIDNREKMVELFMFLRGEGIQYFILGGGSNVLFRDEGTESVVVKVKTSEIELDGNTLVADAGVSFGILSNFALKNGLSGLEWSAGLPGTVGGAVRGNAGAAGGETAKVISKIEVLSDGEVLELTPDRCEFKYRESIFKRNSDVILRAWFHLHPGDPKESLKTMQEIIKKRSGYYPPYPSAGSFFKNVAVEKWSDKNGKLPEQFGVSGMIPAGWLNEQAGLKGLRVGGAMVSLQHGNFLINFDKATGEDMRILVEEVKSRVYNKFNIELEEEVHIVRN